uniref:Uncharacterized protein n=1 Tax=Panagrolaimus sp. ES5 TaxID=591445 RepID=A0AC34GVS4_9BILA
MSVKKPADEDFNVGFKTIFEAIEKLEGETFFINKNVIQKSASPQTKVIATVDRSADSSDPSASTKLSETNSCGPPPEKDVDFFFNFIKEIRDESNAFKIISYNKHPMVAKHYCFNPPDNIWLNNVYLFLKINFDYVQPSKLKEMKDIKKIGQPLKRYYVQKKNSLFRSLSYLIVGNEEYYHQLIHVVDKYKALMNMEINTTEIVLNDNLRAFAKLFAINILVYISDNVSKWICYGPGEFFFECLDDLKNGEYKTGKWSHFEAITSLSAQ